MIPHISIFLPRYAIRDPKRLIELNQEMNKMAMTLRNESIEIIVPNSEAYKGAQIKGIKDSTVGGY